MAVTRHTLTGDFGTIVGGEFADRSVKAWLTTNLNAGEALVDLAANVIQPGSIELTLTAGAFSQSLIATNSADTNIADDSLRYRVLFSYVDPLTRTRVSWDSDYFELTANADLSDVAGTIEAPLSWRSAFVTEMEALRDEAVAEAAAQVALAEAAAAAAVDISNISTSDDVVEALVKNTGGAGPKTSAELAVSYAAKWKANTAYLAGAIVQAPDGPTIKRIANGTSRASYDATEQLGWTRVAAKVGVFDANAAPYSCVPNDAAHDNAAGLEACITAAITWAKANTGAVVIELDDGEYYLIRDVQTTGNCRAQVPILPRVAMTDQRVSLTIRSKQGARPINRPWNAPNKGGVIFRSTLTGKIYSAAFGWPAMFGAIDLKYGGAFDGINQASWMTLTFQGVTFRQPENPCLAAVNASLIDYRVFEDCAWDTLGMGADGHYTVQPTHPTGIADLPPMNGLDGNEWRGDNMVSGYYAGPSIGELMNNGGTIYSYENYVAANIQAPWHHLAMIGFFFDVRCAYGFAQIDGTSGIVAIPDGLEITHRTHLKGTYDAEDKTSGWNQRIKHFNDPNNKLAGRIDYLRVLAGTGSVNGALVNNGGIYVNYTDLTTPAAQPNYAFVHTFTGADSTTTAGAADTGQTESQLSGVWGRSSNQAYRVSGTGTPADAWESSVANGTFQWQVTHPTNSTDALALFRLTDNSNHMIVDLYRDGTGIGQVLLLKRVAGTATQCGSTVSLGALGTGSHDVKVVTNSTNVKVYFDGILRIDYTGTTGQEAATKVGIGVTGTGAGNVRFDNITVL